MPQGEAPVIWLALACTPDPAVVAPDRPAPDPVDTAADGPWPRPCGDLFDPDVVPEFDLDLGDGGFQALVDDCAAGAKVYRPATFRMGDEVVPASVRLKGNWSWSCEKFQFVVSFNEEDDDARFHGARKLVLDAPWYDRTLVHERLGYAMFAAHGIRSACSNHARLSIDGVYYGVYANNERLDQGWLDRNFRRADGILYETWNERKTNEQADDHGRMNALKGATTVEALAEVVDFDQALSEWAMEAMMPAMDNYWAGVEINYYLYDHPERGFQWVPFDLDASFGDSVYPDGSPVFPGAVAEDPITGEHEWWAKEPLVKLVLADPARCAQFVDEVRRARAVYDPAVWSAQVTAWDAQIADALAEDPHKTFTDAQHEADVAALQAFLVERAAFVDAWLARGGQCPGPP